MIAVLALAFVVVPLAELAVIVAVARQIGIPETIGILLAVSIAGSLLAKREGIGVWRRFHQALSRGEIPSSEILDGFLVLLGAAFLLTPGFLTDVLGLVLLIPPTRRAVRAGVRQASRSWIARRMRRGFPEGPGRGARRVRVIRVESGPGPASGHDPGPPDDGPEPRRPAAGHGG